MSDLPEFDDRIDLNGSKYTVKNYLRLVKGYEVFVVCFDKTQQLPCPEEIVVKVYLDDAQKGPAQLRFENERNAYGLLKKYNWGVVQYYGEVQWLTTQKANYVGIALQYFDGESLCKPLVAKMSIFDRDRLTRRLYQLMSRMADDGLSIGDIDPSHVMVKLGGEKMDVRVIDFDQSDICVPYIALIMNNQNMSTILQNCWVDYT